jgi:AhpD family alkylhydroperoxidase
MERRLNPYKVSPKGYQGMTHLEQFADSCGLEQRLRELVKMRASEINGAYCLDRHSNDARALGETEQRLYLLNAWRESLNTPTANEPRSNGPKRSRWSPNRLSKTTLTRA